MWVPFLFITGLDMCRSLMFKTYFRLFYRPSHIKIVAHIKTEHSWDLRSYDFRYMKLKTESPEVSSPATFSSLFL